MLASFKKYISQHLLIHHHERLLIAVSGGVDSVVLVHLSKLLGNSIVLAHCNFQLRGEESERDEAFVRKLAREMELPLLVKRFDTEILAAQTKKGIQELARELRYGWFRELITPSHPECCADIMVTAHHADDNIETLLMHFFRGTGLNGLGAMEPRQNKLVRPLLFARKTELIAFAKENNIGYVEDSSNLSDKYTRNYFRHSVLPLLKEVYPQVEGNMLENIRRFRETNALYQQQVEQLRKKLVQVQGKNLGVPVLLLEKQPGLATLVYELFQPYGFTPGQSQDIVSLLKAQSGKQVSSASHRVIRHRNWLLIVPQESVPEGGVWVWEEGMQDLVYAGGRLTMATAPPAKNDLPATPKNTALLDAKLLQFPLMVRPWKPGDYFYPLGMNKKKKLSRFMIDQKLSVAEKEKVYVLESAGRIVWVIHHRMDDRFKIKTSTLSQVEISVFPNE